MFHIFDTDISQAELPELFNNPFYYCPHPLCEIAAREVRALLNGNASWAADAAKGKMMGVLVVRDQSGRVGYVAGFSGLLAGCNRQPGFVPPVFDFLAPDGYFKSEEKRISAINAEMEGLKTSDGYVAALNAVAAAEGAAVAELASRREEFAANKRRRAARREGGGLTPDEAALLVRESQFEKAELKRLARSLNAVVDEKKAALRVFEERLAALSAERKRRSSALQEWLFSQFKVLDARGEEKSLLDIFSEQRGCLPPAGTGECAAPKMLQYAYTNGLQPLAMAEFWVGASPCGEVRRDGCFYGSCMGKCYPVLTHMLQGLPVEASLLERGGDNVSDTKIIYEDGDIVVVEKPSGVLSVPGIVGGVSVQEWLRSTLKSNDVFVAHRLDMATSGLLVVAKSMEVFKKMQSMFAERRVEKRYAALLSGVLSVAAGVIELPLSPDYDNRPAQKVDYAGGKPARTLYKAVSAVCFKGMRCAFVSLVPVTGRTHQLRVHCAHASGLGLPIVGDVLYGGYSASRLMLHAEYLSFLHPVSGERVEFSSPFVVDCIILKKVDRFEVHK